MNNGRLKARAAAELGLKTTGDEGTMLQEWANEGVVDVLIETKAHMDIASATLTAGEGSYQLDSDILLADERTFTIPVRVVTVADLLALPSEQSDVVRYVAFDGDMMLVYPLPAANDEVSFLFVPRPAAMSSDLHDPSTSTYGGLPEQIHFAVLDYMLKEGARYDGSSPPMLPKDYEDRYEKYSLPKARKRVQRRQGRGQKEPRVGYPQRPTYGLNRGNDRYPF